jgi:hypothetical protein
MTIDEKLQNIAEVFLRIETLEKRNSDALDFHNVSVWDLKEALSMAYWSGVGDTTHRNRPQPCQDAPQAGPWTPQPRMVSPRPPTPYSPS